MKVYACNTVKIYKNKTQNIFKWGGGAHARRAGPGSAFACKPTEQLTDLDVHVVIAKAFILIKLK